MTSSIDGITPTAVPGLVLRPVRWPDEAAALTAIYNAGSVAAGKLEVVSVGEQVNDYAHLEHSDLAADLRLAEHEGRPIAYVRVDWRDEVAGGRLHDQGLFVLPEAPVGTLEAILDWSEDRSRAIAAGLAPRPPASLGAHLTFEVAEQRAVLERRGYRAARHFSGMLRPTLDGILEVPLPPGVEIRPVEAGDLRAIFDAETAAFRTHWGASSEDASDASWLAFRDDPLNDLALWQVAWAGGRVVGIVRPYINFADFDTFGVRRGWCENISTHADWRGRGIAKALIGRALVALRERGLQEAVLGVDAANETGAIGVYRAMGFEERWRETEFRRPLVPAEPQT